TSLVAGAPGSYTVDSAASFTGLTITFPAADITLVAAAAPPGSPTFKINLNSWEALINTGANAGTAYAAGNLQTDVTGAVAFTVGATLDTDNDGATITSQYIDAAYSGNYTIAVDY
ncbi:MAG: hypothetical protein RPR97_03740, partial [Colwellia sp.]